LAVGFATAFVALQILLLTGIAKEKRRHYNGSLVNRPSPNAMTELFETVRPIFVAAGWRSGRRVDVPAMVPSNHPASAILAEFGDLTVGDGGAGQECAT